MDDANLILHLVRATDDANMGDMPSPAHMGLLRALTFLRSHDDRLQLYRRTETHFGQITDEGRGVLRVVLGLVASEELPKSS